MCRREGALPPGAIVIDIQEGKGKEKQISRGVANEGSDDWVAIGDAVDGGGDSLVSKGEVKEN